MNEYEDAMDYVVMSLDDLEQEQLNGIQIMELQYNGNLNEYYGEEQ